MLLIAALVISSCGDVSILNPAVEEGPTLEVKSVSQGGTLNLGDPVTFRLSSPSEEEQATNLDIKLVDENGAVVASQSLSDPSTEADITIDFPGLETGRYRIEFTLYGEDTILLEREITFFYITGSYLINGIESFPPVNPPSSNVLLKALLDVPEGSDPYIRWKQAENLLASGVLSEGIANIYWQAPNDDGVYSISVELFPVPPLEGTDFSFQSANIMKTELYISSSEDQQSSDFAPRESYFSLFHLQGSLSDSGSGFSESELSDAIEIGYLEPAVHENILGYRFTADSGFRVPRFLLPVEYEELKPFTLSLGISLETLVSGARIISLETEDGEFELNLYIGEDLEPAAEVKLGSQSLAVPSEIPELQINKRYVLSLSILPQPDSRTLTARWHLDSLATGTVVFEDVALTGLPSRGVTVVGGADGFSGILDEIGVYFRDSEGNASIDPSLF
jgi:hypothetical protein